MQLLPDSESLFLSGDHEGDPAGLVLAAMEVGLCVITGVPRMLVLSGVSERPGMYVSKVSSISKGNIIGFLVEKRIFKEPGREKQMDRGSSYPLVHFSKASNSW